MKRPLFYPDDRQTFIDAAVPEMAATFFRMLATVVENMRLLHREGVRYDVAQQHSGSARQSGLRRAARRFAIFSNSYAI